MRRRVPVSIVLVSVFVLCVPGARSGEKEDAEAQAKGWEYPKAKVMASSGAEGLYTVVATTADDLDTVLEHYGKKFGKKVSVHTSSAGGVESRDGKTTSTHHDSFQPYDDKKKDYPPRAVTVGVSSQNTKSYFVTVVVSRVKGEGHTHIVLTYVKK
jgi:hypothetical protein